MKHLESQLQCACVFWFRLQYPKYAKQLFAIPNGGLRNKIVAAKLKLEGVTPGVYDLMLAKVRNGFPGLFIEMKYGKNDLTDSQKEIKQLFSEEGYKMAEAWTKEEFMQIVNDYLK